MPSDDAYDEGPGRGRMGWLERSRRNPSALLLLVQLAGVLVYPAMEEVRGGRVAFEIFGIAVLVLAVLSVRASPGLTWPSVLLGVAAGALSLADALHATRWLQAVSSALHAAFYVYAAYCLLRYMLTDHEVTTDELFASGATFTLLAWGFAYIYLCVQTLQPGAFAASTSTLGLRTWNRVAVPELHDPVEHRSQRHPASHSLRARRGDARADRRRRLHRHGRVAVGRHDAAAAPVEKKPSRSHGLRRRTCVCGVCAATLRR